MKRKKVLFEDYLTDIDITSHCERLPDDYQAHLDQDAPEWWRDVDQDDAFQRKYEDGYVDGHSAGMADGMNLIDEGAKWKVVT